MNALEKYVTKVKLASLLLEKLAAPTKGAPSIVSRGYSPIGWAGRLGAIGGAAGLAGLAKVTRRTGPERAGKIPASAKVPPSRRKPGWRVYPDALNKKVDIDRHGPMSSSTKRGPKARYLSNKSPLKMPTFGRVTP